LDAVRAVVRPEPARLSQLEKAGPSRSIGQWPRSSPTKQPGL
jgi:hypothetical protein